MRYSRRELRAVDLLALILVGLGALCILLAVVVAGQGGPGSWLGAYAAGGGVFTSSGFALHLKLAQIQRHGGREPERDGQDETRG